MIKQDQCFTSESRELLNDGRINLGKKVQDFRNMRGMSLRELAKRAGMTASMLSQIERDLVKPFHKYAKGYSPGAGSAHVQVF